MRVFPDSQEDFYQPRRNLKVFRYKELTDFIKTSFINLQEIDKCNFENKDFFSNRICPIPNIHKILIVGLWVSKI